MTSAVATRKSIWAVRKHASALAGTGFEKCASCPGTGGKVEDGKMCCSRAGAAPVPITAEQALRCDGKKPTVGADPAPAKGLTAIVRERVASQ